MFKEKTYSHSMFTIRKIGILVSIFFSFFFLAPAFAEANEGPPVERHHFSLSPLLGMFYGQAEELVFRPGSDRLLSELLWDLKPLFYVGLAAEFGPRDPFQDNGFIAAASIKFGLPFRSGNHENRDWLNPQHGRLTHFSQHDVYTQNAILLDISAGYSWRLTDTLALRAHVAFSFMHFSWSGENGFIQYPTNIAGEILGTTAPPWSSDLPKIPLHGMVIRYSQNWFIFAPGISFTWRGDHRFSMEGSFSYSPLIFCAARDDHLLRRITFFDYMSFGHFFNGGGSFVFAARDNLDIAFSVFYRYITGTRGRTYQQNNVTGRTYLTTNDGAGAGFSALTVGLAARIRLIGRN